MHERRTGILLAAAATTGLGLASAAQAVTIDFDTQSDFDNNFSAPETAGEVAWSADTGIGGVAGRLNSTAGTQDGETAWYNTAFDLDDGPLTVSVFFRAIAYTDTTASRIAVGLAEDFASPGSSNLRDNSLVQVRLLKNNATTGVFQIRDAEPGATSTSGVTLTDGNWYRISLTVEKGDDVNTFDITASLEDWGADGLTDPGTAIATASGTRTRSAFYTGDDVDPLYVGFMGQNAGGGTDAFDNFTIVPEPAALGLSALGALTLLAGRHR